MNQSRLAVFDCDGTLVDSQHSIVSAMEATFDRHDLERPDHGSIRRMIGLPLDRAIGHLAPGADIDQHTVMVDTYKEAFRDMRRIGTVHEPLFPGVVEALAVLAEAGWLLGVATGKARRGLLATLEPYGLLGHFVTMQTADVALGKPHPDMLERAMAEAGVTPASTVMIGDTTYDIEMACNAGVRSVGVSWGYHPSEDLHAAGAGTVIDNFNALSGAIDSLMEGAI